MQLRSTALDAPAADRLSRRPSLPAQYLLPMRAAMRVWTWQDPMLTSILCVGLAIAAVLLALVPWPSALYYGGRIGGLAALGPHMYYFGKKREEQSARTAAEEARFQAADAKGKALILQEYRDKLMEKAKAKIEANEASSKRKTLTDAQLQR